MNSRRFNRLLRTCPIGSRTAVTCYPKMPIEVRGRMTFFSACRAHGMSGCGTTETSRDGASDSACGG